MTTKVAAVLMEYLRQVTSAIELREAQPEESDFQLKKLKSSIEKELKTVGRETLSSFMRLYEAQGRGWKCDLVQEEGSASAKDITYHGTFHFTKLHRLAKSPDSDAPLMVRADGGNVNSRDIHDWTPLHYTAAKGSVHVVEQLLPHQTEVNARDLLEWTPLHYACQRGETIIVQCLLRKGADVNAQGRNGVAPLHCAAMNGQQGVVSLLIEAGAGIDVLDASGNTPLLLATYKGHKGVFEYIWPDANKRLRDHIGRAALHLASTARMEEVVSWLVREVYAGKEAKDHVGRTPLHCAAANGHEAVVRLSVEQGADKEAKDSNS